MTRLLCLLMLAGAARGSEGPGPEARRLADPASMSHQQAEAAVSSLDEAGVRTLVPVLLGSLRSANPNARMRAKRLLRRMDQNAAGAILDILRSGEAESRRMAAFAAAELGPIRKTGWKHVDAALRAALKDPDPSMRYAAAAALRTEKESIRLLVEAARSRDWLVRWYAADSLGNSSDFMRDDPPLLRSAAEALGSLLSDKTADIREEAARSLWTMAQGGDKDALGAAAKGLQAALKDPIQDVRWWSAMALGWIRPQDPASLPALGQALDAGLPAHRLAAAEALMEMGPAARPALKPLRAMLKNPDDDISRYAAAAAVARIAADPAEALPVLKEGAKLEGNYYGDLCREALQSIEDRAPDEAACRRPKRPSSALSLPELLRKDAIFLAEYRDQSPEPSRARLTLMDLDGGNPRALPVMPEESRLVFGLAIDPVEGAVYWVDDDNGIFRAKLDGTGRKLVANMLANPRGLALDPKRRKMFWEEWSQGGNVGRIMAAGLDGSDPKAIVEASADGSAFSRPALDVDNGKVYFGDLSRHEIRRCNLDGTQQEVVLPKRAQDPAGVAVDAACGMLYWADTDALSTYVARASMSGERFRRLRVGPAGSSGIEELEVDAKHDKLYWIDEIDTDSKGPEKGVWVSDLDGRNARRIYASQETWSPGAFEVWLAP